MIVVGCFLTSRGSRRWWLHCPGDGGELRELPRHIANLAAGEEAPMTVFRDGAEHTLTVIIGALPTPEKVAATGPAKTDTPKFGMMLAALDDQMRARFGLGRDDTGVVVTRVDPNGIAAAKGVRPGDVIRRISGQKVDSPPDVARIAEKALSGKTENKRKVLLVLVNRKGKDRYVALPLRDA